MEHEKLKRSRPSISQEDLALLATPMSELKKQTHVFSFDADRFKSRILSDGERWQHLLQAHLYFDHVITRMLEDALPNAGAVDLDRMAFSQKLRFIAAMKLLSSELVSTVTHINDLRNKIAHNLEFEITDQHELDLKNCTPKGLREIMETDKDHKPGPLRFNELLYVVLLQIEVIRHSHALERLNMRKSTLRLRSVLDRTPGVVWNE